ncbi:hypothetical protein WP50_15625 [Lactiplantibacillus plantarum]|nr:hypothetical protein WP50_15625 [Lactiplantibacillus plantarum]
MNNWVHPTLVTVLIRKIVAAPGAHNVPSVNPRVTAVAEKRVASLTWRSNFIKSYFLKERFLQ